LISLEMEAAPFMSSTNSEGALRSRKRSFSLLLKRLKQLLNKRKTRSFVPSWSLGKSGRRLIAEFRKVHFVLLSCYYGRV